MYAADREELIATAPSRASSFFTAAGQRERITRTWPEQDCLGFVAAIGDHVVGLLILEDIADGAATMGYYVASAARRRGVATAALGALVRVARQDVGLVRLVADIDPGNVASRLVAERNGCLEVGSVVIDGATFDRFVVNCQPESASTASIARTTSATSTGFVSR